MVECTHRAKPWSRQSGAPRGALNAGGYDASGAYYGIGETLYEATPEADGLEPFRFRAKDRGAARATVKGYFPQATFYR